MKQGVGRKELIRVLLLGGAGSGKTALAVMFERKFFHKSYEPTIMAETHSKEMPGSLSQLTEYNQHIKNVDGIVAVYDITSLPSFSKIEPLVKYCQQIKHCSCVLVGTKQDLEKERAIRIQDGTSLANDLGCPFLEITATSEEAVNGMFKLAAKLILDDSDPKKAKKGGLKRLLKFKKKKDGTSVDVYEETEEEDEAQSTPSDGANHVRKKKEKEKEKKEKKERKRREKEGTELCSDSDGDPELQQLMHFHLPTSFSVSPKLAPRTASPITVLAPLSTTPLATSNSLSPSSFESNTNNNNNINNNNYNNNNNYHNFNAIHNNTTANTTTNNNNNYNSINNNNSNINNNNYNNNFQQDTKVVNPTPASTPNSVRAFELIHYMTELKALLIQNKDYASLQSQLVTEREIRLELEMKNLSLQKELQAYKLKYGELK